MATKKNYKIKVTRVRLYGDSTERTYEGTLEELTDMFSYTLECGASWSYEKGNSQINRHPKTIKSLISNLNKASRNSSRCYQSHYYDLVI